VVTEAVANLEKYNRDKGAFLDSYPDQFYQTFAGETLNWFRLPSTSWSMQE
jgi:hypothetical protein